MAFDIIGDKMGKQFEFYMDEKDEEILKECLLRSDVKILFDGKTPPAMEIIDFPPAFSSIGWFHLYLYKEKWGQLRDQSLAVYIYSLPIIEFRRTVIRADAKEISPGRIWYQNRYFDEDENLVEKCKDIDLFYYELKKKIKQILPNHKRLESGKNKTFYCSESIKELLDDGYKIR